MNLSINFPESVFAGLQASPEHIAQELRLAAAAKWYEMGRISQGKAAEIAGLSREEFIDSLASFKVSPFQPTAKELEEEIQR